MRYFPNHPLLALIAAMVLVACDSAGGGAGAAQSPSPTPTPVAAPTPTPTPAPGPTPTPTAFDTAEYRASGGAVSMNALAAYTRGFSGAGIKVAVIDTGLDIDNPDFTGRIDPASADLTSGARLADANGHGTGVTALLAARRDGVGTHGVAFDATIIAFRAEPPCATSCFMSLAAVEEGIDRARIAGARVINLSMIADAPPSIAMRAAIDRATAAGVIVTICAGNESRPQPQAWGAGLADEAAIARGLVILVGAVDGADQIYGFSNRAGPSADHFLTAASPSCSGATPLVSGAIALLAQANPTMTSAQLVAALYASARDAGAPGQDAVYGRGIVDLTAAFR